MKKIFLILILISTTIAQTSQISSEALLRLRDLQYEQAKRIIKMQDLKTEFDKLNSEQQQISVQIENWIKEQAKQQNIDMTTHKYDLDKLKFVEIAKQEKQNE